MRRTLLVVVGTLLVLTGIVWTLQGLGYLGGSAMSGETVWAVVGPALTVVGVGLGAAGLRGRRPSP